MDKLRVSASSWRHVGLQHSLQKQGFDPLDEYHGYFGIRIQDMGGNGLPYWHAWSILPR